MAQRIARAVTLSRKAAMADAAANAARFAIVAGSAIALILAGPASPF